MTGRSLGASGRSLVPKEDVGINLYADQLVSHKTDRGFEFNILVVGETGIGKTTLLSSLFKTDMTATHSEEVDTKNGKIEIVNHKIEEDGVMLELNVIFSQGFGGDINNEKCEQPLVEYVDEQFEKFMDMEWSVPRRLDDLDPRVHLCIYMITPTGRSIKSHDLPTMKALAKKTNLVPVIAKSDSVSKDAVEDFKDRVMQDLEDSEVEVYEFPLDDGDEEAMKLNEGFQAEMPFAVVGSQHEIDINGKKVRARQYPWGVVEVENDEHCQFNMLRSSVIRNNMEALISSTHDSHYHKYRKEKMTQLGYADNEEDAAPFSILDNLENKKKQEKVETEQKKDQMRKHFVQKVKDKEEEFEAERRKMDDRFDPIIAKLQEKIAQQNSKNSALKAAIENQKADLNSPNPKDKKKRSRVF